MQGVCQFPIIIGVGHFECIIINTHYCNIIMTHKSQLIFLRFNISITANILADSNRRQVNCLSNCMYNGSIPYSYTHNIGTRILCPCMLNF